MKAKEAETSLKYVVNGEIAPDYYCPFIRSLSVFSTFSTMQMNISIMLKHNFVVY